MSWKNIITEPETLENLVVVVNRLAKSNETMEDVIDLTRFMVPAFMEIGEDLAYQATKVGQKVYTQENMELAKRVQAAAPAYMRLLDTMIRMGEDGTIDKLRQMMESAVEAMADVDIDNPRKFSVFEAAKDLNDKDLQRTLGMVVDIAKKLPAAMEKRRAEA